MGNAQIMVLLICSVAFFASLLTFVSGFGLGTILLPVFGLFFPINQSIALTGVVHLLNNLFKTGLIGKSMDRTTVLWFGIPSVIGGIGGAFLLSFLSELPPIFTWTLAGKTMEISLLKLFIGFALALFAIVELLPSLKNYQFSAKHLTVGGLLSGFMGGLSGMQGALRSAFLLKNGLTKEQFIATGIVIACLVDLTRLPIYYSRFMDSQLSDNAGLLISATLSAFAGAWLGNRLLKKITLRVVQLATAGFILIISGLLIAGVL